MVIPVRDGSGAVIAVLDIDSDRPDAFTRGRCKAARGDSPGDLRGSARQRRDMALADHARVIGLAAEDLAYHRLEMLKRPAVVIRVEARLVPAFAELRAAVETGMVAEPVARVAVPAIMMARSRASGRSRDAPPPTPRPSARRGGGLPPTSGSWFCGASPSPMSCNRAATIQSISAAGPVPPAWPIAARVPPA